MPRQPHHLALNRTPGSGGLRATAAEAPSPRAFGSPHFPLAVPEWPQVQLAHQTLPLPSLAPSGSVQSPPCRMPTSPPTRPLLTLLLGATDAPSLGSVPGVCLYLRSPFHRMMFLLNSKQATPEASNENKRVLSIDPIRKFPLLRFSLPVSQHHAIPACYTSASLLPGELGGGRFPPRLPSSHGTSARLTPHTHAAPCVCFAGRISEGAFCANAFSQLSCDWHLLFLKTVLLWG